MLMSNILIVVDPRHPDGNSLHHIVAALEDAGAAIHEVDAYCHTIEATLPAHDVALVDEMGGIVYIRTLFRYQTA